MSLIHRALCCAMLAAVLGASSVARADATSDRCVDENTRGQSLRLDGKLSLARRELEACNDPRCPAIVREDCATRLAEIDRAQPTIAFDVVRPGGATGAVRATIDGRAIDTPLDAPMRVDPGKHVFTFAIEGREPVTRELDAREGEGARRERVEFGPPTAERRVETPSPEADDGSGRRTIGLALGAAGVVGIGVGAVFGVLTNAAADRQRGHCESPTKCPDRAQALVDHDVAITNGTISTVAFVAGAAMFVGGSVLFFTAPRGAANAKGAKIVVAPSLGAQRGVSIRGEF